MLTQMEIEQHEQTSPFMLANTLFPVIMLPKIHKNLWGQETSEGSG